MPRRLHPEGQTVCGVPFLTLETGAPRYRWEWRRLRRGLELLERQGVRRVALQGGDAELLRGTTLQPVDCGPLRRALLPQLLDWAELRWQIPLGRCAVRLTARQTDGATVQAAFALARRVRYLELDTGAGQAVLAEELQRRLGLGGGHSGPVMLEVCLSGECRGAAPVLHLGGEMAQQRLELTAPHLPDGEESLFSAIFQEGKMAISDIEVRFVEFCA